MEELLGKLIEWVQQASPQLWAILLKQVYSEAITNFVWVFILLVIAALFVLCGRKVWSDDDDFDDHILGGFIYAIAFCLAIAASVILTEAIKFVVNPEFYAIRFILYQLGSH